jgi:hypothetical protein
MIDYWEEVADDEQEDDSVCTNGNACDHPCCPEHGDSEDNWQVPASHSAVRPSDSATQQT